MIEYLSFTGRCFAPLPIVAALMAPAILRADNCIRVEVLIRNDSPQSQNAVKYLTSLQDRWPGLAVEIRDVLTDKAALSRAHQLLKYYKIKEPGVPIIHASRQLIVGFHGEQTTGQQIEDLLTVHVYARDGCPHCAEGKRFLAKMKTKYPGFKMTVHEITRDTNAREEMFRLAERYNMQATSVPVIHLCGELIVGYLSDATSGARIEKLLKQSSVICPENGAAALSLSGSTLWMMGANPQETNTVDQDPPPPPDDIPPDELLRELPLTELAPPEDGNSNIATAPIEEEAPVADLPFFGVIDIEKIGLPLFTIAVGLVDGFNPCAMWVLLFLLSILVNLKDRRKILAVAGTFVLISGVAYFAFMAAWLNAFLFVAVEYLRPVQIVLGILAITVGGIHLKDFFAPHRGLSLSIPDSAKPGIYARVRKIVTAEHLYGAILGAIVLAVLVNTIELLCTSGLPAIFTHVLTMHNLSRWQNYAYLGLYNLAYIFDDTLMVAIVVTTLSRRKLQEGQGRWLKLVSGLVIVLLGLVLLFRPTWLV